MEGRRRVEEKEERKEEEISQKRESQRERVGRGEPKNG